MRKIFYLMTFMVCAIWFASCVPLPESQVGMNESTRNHSEQVVSYECQYCHKEHYLLYNKFVLGGHNYIMFTDRMGRDKGIIHDPDCPCHNPVNQSLNVPVLDIGVDTQKDDEYDFTY